MNKRSTTQIFLAVAVLVLVTLACGSDSSGTLIGEVTPGATSEPARVETFKVGDIVEVRDHRITLTGVEFRGNLLVANFLVENTSTSDVSMSSLLSFEARDESGTKLDTEIFDCGSSIDGKVLPGDRLRGNVCWSGLTTETAKIYYQASLLGSGAVVWEVSKDDPTPSEAVIEAGTDQGVSAFGIGDVIEVQNHTIVLNSATVRNNILEANFTIVNNGTSELNVSSILSFSARDAGGNQLDQEIFDCGSVLDGSVLPNDRVTGNICWSGATTDVLRIYYDATLFGSGAVVWEVMK